MYHGIADEPFASWDVTKRAPIWCDEQWKPFRLEVMKPLAQPSVHATMDSKSVVITLEDGGFEKSTQEFADDDNPSLRSFQGCTGTKGCIGPSILCGAYCLPCASYVVVVMHPEIL